MGTHDAEILRDTLDLLVLQTLSRAPLHGWGVAHQLRHHSRNALRISHGSLYPALHRLEHRGLITAEWRLSETNRRAKYYRLTAAGRRELLREAAGWRKLVRTVDLILGVS